MTARPSGSTTSSTWPGVGVIYGLSCVHPLDKGCERTRALKCESRPMRGADREKWTIMADCFFGSRLTAGGASTVLPLYVTSVKWVVGFHRVEFRMGDFQLSASRWKSPFPNFLWLEDVVAMSRVTLVIMALLAQQAGANLDCYTSFESRSDSECAGTPFTRFH